MRRPFENDGRLVPHDEDVLRESRHRGQERRGRVQVSLERAKTDLFTDGDSMHRE